MIIVGELLNSFRDSVKSAIIDKDSEFICNLAKAQVEAGVDFLDINCYIENEDEERNMLWVLDLITSLDLNISYSLDTANPKAMDSALGFLKDRGTPYAPMINYISAEKDRLDYFIPLAKKYNANLIALLVNDDKLPITHKDRMATAEIIYKELTEAGISPERIFFDPLVKSLRLNDQAGHEVLKTYSLLYKKYPECHRIGGVSNISYGLPNRSVLNNMFLAQAIAMNMDSAILNPTDPNIRGTIAAALAVVGYDPLVMGYLTAHRNHIYD